MQEINNREILIENLSEFINFIKRLDKLSFENKIDVSSFEEPIKVKYKETKYVFKDVNKIEMAEILKDIDSKLNKNQITEIIGFLKVDSEHSFKSLVDSLISQEDRLSQSPALDDVSIFSMLEKEDFRKFLNGGKKYSYFIKEYFGEVSSMILNDVTRSVKFEYFATIINYCLSQNYDYFSELKKVDPNKILFSDKLFTIKNNHSGNELDIAGNILINISKLGSNNVCRKANSPDSFIINDETKSFLMSNVSSSKDLSYQGESWFKYFVGLRNFINENSDYNDWEINTSFIFESPFNLDPNVIKEDYELSTERKNIGVGSNIVNFLNNSKIDQSDREALAHFNFFSIVGACSNLDTMTLLMAHKPIMIGGSSTDLIANSIIINDLLKNSKFNEAKKFTKNIIINNLEKNIDTIFKIYKTEDELFKKENSKKNRNIYSNIYLKTTVKNINCVIKNLSKLGLSYSDIQLLNKKIDEHNKSLIDVGFNNDLFNSVESKVGNDIKELIIKRKNFKELYDDNKNEQNAIFVLDAIKKIDKEIVKIEEDKFSELNNKNGILDKLFDKDLKLTSNEKHIIKNIKNKHLMENMDDIIDYAIKSIALIYGFEIDLKKCYEDPAEIFNVFFELGRKQFGPAYVIDSLMVFNERYKKNSKSFIYDGIGFLEDFNFDEKVSKKNYYSNVNNKFIPVINRLKKEGYSEVAEILERIKPLFSNLVERNNMYGTSDRNFNKVKDKLEKYMNGLDSNQVSKNNLKDNFLKVMGKKI